MRHQTAIALSALLLAGAPALAQQNSRFNDRLMFDPNSFSGARQPEAPPSKSATKPATTTGQSAQPPATHQTAAPASQSAAKPKPAPRTAAAPTQRRAAPTSERRISDDTAGTVTGSGAVGRPVPREQPNLGRLSLPQGSLGYESRTNLQTYDLSDGRRVPGYDNIQRNDSSYFGLSLRMPTGPTTSSSPFALGNHGAN